jgi:hypothetical protein
LLASRLLQQLGIAYSAKANILNTDYIQRRPPTEQSAKNRAVEILVGDKLGH